MRKLTVILATVLLLLGSAVMAEAWEQRDEAVSVPTSSFHKTVIKKKQTRLTVKRNKKYSRYCKGKKYCKRRAVRLTAAQRQISRWRAQGFFTWTRYGGSPLIKNFHIYNPDHVTILENRFDELVGYQIISAVESVELKKRLRFVVENREPEYAQIRHGDQFILLTFKKSGKMIVKRKAIAAGGKGRLLAAIRLYTEVGGRQLEVKIPLICGNITMTPTSDLPKPKRDLPGPVLEEPGPGPADKPPIAEEPPEQLPPSETEPEKKCEGCGGDLYIGAGVYTESHPEQDAKGYYTWVKARYRPLGYSLIKDHIDMCVGGFFYGAFGQGYSEDYKYRWYEYSIGPSVKFIDRKHHWDADIDAGLWGALYSDGYVDLFESDQVDRTLTLGLHVNYYARRVENKKWFPRVEFNLDTRFTYDTTVEQKWDGELLNPKSTDNRRAEVNFDIGIYDININDAIRITPGFNIGFGHSFSENDNFFQIGPNVRFSLYDKDIFHLNILNYKEMLNGDGDQWHPISGWIAPSEMVSAYRAYKTRVATANDINLRRNDKDSPVSDAILNIMPDN